MLRVQQGDCALVQPIVVLARCQPELDARRVHRPLYALADGPVTHTHTHKLTHTRAGTVTLACTHIHMHALACTHTRARTHRVTYAHARAPRDEKLKAGQKVCCAHCQWQSRHGGEERDGSEIGQITVRHRACEKKERQSVCFLLKMREYVLSRYRPGGVMMISVKRKLSESKELVHTERLGADFPGRVNLDPKSHLGSFFVLFFG